MVKEKVSDAVTYNNGLLSVDLIFKIRIPINSMNDFKSIDMHGFSAVDRIKRNYEFAKIEFCDVDKIEIHYYVEMCFK